MLDHGVNSPSAAEGAATKVCQLGNFALALALVGLPSASSFETEFSDGRAVRTLDLHRPFDESLRGHLRNWHFASDNPALLTTKWRQPWIR